MAPLCRQNDSLLLVIDIQEKLLSAMPENSAASLLKHCRQLLQAADTLSVPVFQTEQYPNGLGPTDDTIREALPATVSYFDKTQFSCCGAPDFREQVRATHKRQAVLAGMESHVCVLQTALELQEDGFEVFVVADATCSRHIDNWRNAMARLRQAGVIVTNTESVLFEWLRDARHEQFKTISALLK